MNQDPIYAPYRQVGRRIQTRHMPEERVVVVEDLLKRCRGVVVEVRRGFTDPVEFRNIHNTEVGKLPG